MTVANKGFARQWFHDSAEFWQEYNIGMERHRIIAEI